MATGTRATPRGIHGDPLWYKDAIIYEVHVRAFADSDGDGVGDLAGLTGKLDYLHDLGVTAIWLLPLCASPQKDDGYDISDYTTIHPAYGTLQDFRTFLREAHRRGLSVITELVLNHTSDQHAWFQRARTAPPGSRARNFYVWSDTPDRHRDVRVIFKDFETSNWAWDPVAKAYYWHRFYAHQPDLNYDSPDVQRAMQQVVDGWLELGVDGLRLDAVPYLFEQEGAGGENLPQTHAFLKALRRHVDQRFAHRMFLAEANQWPEDAAAYFGQGDECHMAFHFPLMPRLFMASRLEERFPILDILRQTPTIPDACQWAIFLRNHDELTLEMVTDEERDYMYRAYARDPQMRLNLGIRRRLAPLLWNNRRTIELLNGLLFSMPGTPVIYYGDEIGMGDNVYLGDRNGVRTPMQWSADRNAGFSRANPQRLYLPVIIDPEYHYEALNVEAQQQNPSSLLWWMKRLIALRKRYRAFSRGTIEFLHPENHKILAFLRRDQEETILVVANLSRFTQCAELDLAAFSGRAPVELFGQTSFPAVGSLPYFVTLGPHTFYWFALQPKPEDAVSVRAGRVEPPIIDLDDAWSELWQPGRPAKAKLEGLLPAYLATRRWFGAKARTIRAAKIMEAIPVDRTLVIVFIELTYTQGEAETYLVPLATLAVDRTSGIEAAHLVARLRRKGPQAAEELLLAEATGERAFLELLLDLVRRQRRIKGMAGELAAFAAPDARMAHEPRGSDALLEPRLLGVEQSNTSVIYGERLILKLIRRLEPGVNPELELGRFLTERARFAHSPPCLGAIEYRRPRQEPMTMAILGGFVHSEGDAWRYTLDALHSFLERVLAQPAEAREERLRAIPPAASALPELEEGPVPPLLEELAGPYLPAAHLLGVRTAELHRALASSSDDPQFAPEPFTPHYQRALWQTMQSLTTQVLETLRRRMSRLPQELQPEARSLAGREEELLQRFRPMRDRRLTAKRIRCHGDYHLGQVLWTGKDFVIIDFEGEPARSLSERRIKRSPLRDVAGMLRSFHYAALGVLFGQHAGARHPGSPIRPEDAPRLEPWVMLWYRSVSAVFTAAYLATAAQAPFLPATREELTISLRAYLLEKAIYELGYELNNRPAWVGIPLRGIRQLLEVSASA
jgi:maltose alpha-D-glucosyltransferase/alpha-amylase